jgi:TRAP-type C4-dicarboxylate transport system permease small subunit
MRGENEAGGPSLVRWLARLEIGLVAAMLLAAFGITAYAIVVRNLGDSTGDWTLKLPETLLVWMTFVGAAPLVAEGSHVSADLLGARLPPRVHAGVETLIHLVIIVVLAFIAYGAWQIVAETYAIEERDPELFEWPRWIFLVGLPLGLALTILHFALDIVEVWRRAGRRP